MKCASTFPAVLLLSPLAALFAAAPSTSFQTEILAFEDTFLFGTPPEGSLVYRVEGKGVCRRTVGSLNFEGGAASYIHPAQYDRPALRLRMTVTSGEPGIAIAHNGMRDNRGNANASPGIEVVLREHDTALRDLKSHKILSTIPAVFPRGREETLTIAWDTDTQQVRVDLPDSTHTRTLTPGSICPGGFALRAPESPRTSFRVMQTQVLWQDVRECVFYDGYDTVYDLHGARIGGIPPAKLPDGITTYSTASMDLRRCRALIALGASGLSYERPETIKGWAVRDLMSGALDVLAMDSSVNGCVPCQGGGGIDGYWLMQSWAPPASLCWLDWNAYDRGDRTGFIKPFKTATKSAGVFIGYHDPGNALDGSMARYLRITESWHGVTRLTVHPNIAAYAPFDDITLAEPSDPLLSHTGPAGMPTQLVVRDRDRAWYEQWAYLSHGLHVQNRGYNLFARRDDWAAPLHATNKDADAYVDYANPAPDLLASGRLMASHYRFAPAEPAATRIQNTGNCRLTIGKDRFIEESKLPLPPLPVPFQILVDPSGLIPSSQSSTPVP